MENVEHPFDRKDRLDSNRAFAAMKKKISTLTAERDELIARYEPHNVTKPPRPAKRRAIVQAPFLPHAFALRKYCEAVEDIGAGFGKGDIEDPAELFDSYWAMFVTVDGDARRPEPLTDAEAEQAYGHYERMVAHHLAGGRIGS